MARYDDLEDEETASTDLVYHRETDMAWGLSDGDDDLLIWFPKSKCSIHPIDPDRGDPVVLTGPEWLLTERGVI